MLPETFQCNDIKQKPSARFWPVLPGGALSIISNLPTCIIHYKTYIRSVDFGGHGSLFLLTCRGNVEKPFVLFFWGKHWKNRLTTEKESYLWSDPQGHGLKRSNCIQIAWIPGHVVDSPALDCKYIYGFLFQFSNQMLTFFILSAPERPKTLFLGRTRAEGYSNANWVFEG